MFRTHASAFGRMLEQGAHWMQGNSKFQQRNTEQFVFANNECVLVLINVHFVCVVYCAFTVKMSKTLCIHISKYPCIRASVHPCIRVSMYQCFHVSMYPYIQVSMYPTIHVSMYPTIHVSIYPTTHVSMYPCINVSIHPSIHVSLFQSILVRHQFQVCEGNFQRTTVFSNSGINTAENPMGVVMTTDTLETTPLNGERLSLRLVRMRIELS